MKQSACTSTILWLMVDELEAQSRARAPSSGWSRKFVTKQSISASRSDDFAKCFGPFLKRNVCGKYKVKLFVESAIDTHPSYWKNPRPVKSGWNRRLVTADRPYKVAMQVFLSCQVSELICSEPGPARGGVWEVHFTRAVLGPGRMEARKRSLSVIEPKITSVSQLSAQKLIYFQILSINIFLNFTLADVFD